MKFNADREVLLRALNHAQAVVNRRVSAGDAVLSCVLLDLKGDRLMLTSTDLDITLAEAISVSGSSDGRLAVPAGTFHDIVRQLPGGAEISFETSNDAAGLVIRCKRFATRLPVPGHESFPVSGDAVFPHSFRMRADALLQLFERSRFAVSTEESRHYLCGVYFHVADSNGSSQLRGVATDGHRLAQISVPAPEGAGGMPGVIVPRKTVAELCKLLSETDGEVEVSVSETRLRVAMPDVLITTKLVDGTYPDYQRVIPPGTGPRVEVSRGAFVAAMARITAITEDRTSGLKIEGSRRGLRLSLSSPDCGQAEEEIDGDSVVVDGADFSVGFRAVYLRDVANETGEKLCMALSDAEGQNAAIFRAVNDDTALFVVMPMRV